MHRDGLVVVGVEHGVDGRKRCSVVGVACKADEDHQVVVAAVVKLAVGRFFRRLYVLFTLMTTLKIFLFGNLHIRLQPNRSRVDAVDTVGRSHHLASGVAHGIAVVTIFVFRESEAVGIVHIVVELIARGKAFDDLAIGLGEANGDIL